MIFVKYGYFYFWFLRMKHIKKMKLLYMYPFKTVSIYLTAGQELLKSTVKKDVDRRRHIPPKRVID